MKKKLFIHIGLYIVTLLILVVSIRTCLSQEEDVLSFCSQVLEKPGYCHKTERPPYYYEAGRAGYAFFTKDIVPDISGYAGPINILIGIDSHGKIIRLKIISHAETPGFVGPLEPFIKQFISKDYTDPFVLGKDIDGITGATITSEAITQAIQQSARIVMSHILKSSSLPTVKPSEKGATYSNPKEEKIKERLSNKGINPQEAKYWKFLNE